MEENNAVRNAPAVLSFDSFDGGGPEYSARIGDPSVAAFTRSIKYAFADHELMDGSAYQVIFSFTGLMPGETNVRISSRSPITADEAYDYILTVDERLNVSALAVSRDTGGYSVRLTCVLVIEAGGRRFCAIPEDNASARAFTDRLEPAPVEVVTGDFGGFAKLGALPWSLPENARELTAEPGDVILYGKDRIGVCYAQNRCTATRMASIGAAENKVLTEALGTGCVTLGFRTEWSE
ncbi:MAG: hypothetical protein J5827_01635 [Oscillospiraceae bacterium]|nr:hypothetical protein [Oscillospiraceae bacterium]